MSLWSRTGLVVACVAALALRGTAVRADDDLDALLAALARTEDSAGRLAQVPKLAASASPAAAGALAGLVRRDPDARVRVAAAEGLGESPAANALDLLLERVRAGGTRQVRRALAISLARREGAAARVLGLLRNDRVPEGDRVLLVQTLEVFEDDATRLALVASARAGPHGVRDAALRALARRRDSPEKRRTAMVELLETARDVDSTLAALDAFEPAAHADLRPVVERLATSLEPSVREAATHLLAKIRATEPPVAKAAANPGAAPPAPDGRYAPARPRPGDDPPEIVPEAVPWPRHDLVYVVDVTGSTGATLPGLKRRILDEAALIFRLGGSHRIGVVAYRDGSVGPDGPPRLEVLSPTPSLARLTEFLEALRARGVDERGAEVAGALREALDRTPWRWEARREVHLFADTKCDDPRAAAAVVGIHYRADATRTRVAYVLRTRSRIPPEFEELARAGGGGAPEGVK